MYFQAFERLCATDAPILAADAAERQALRAALDRAGRGDAPTAWLATPVLTWQQALADAHAAALIAGRLPEGADLLLSGAQEMAVWSAAIAADGELELAAPLQVAPLARQAWRLRHLWGVAVAAGLQASVDQRAYLRWETAYRRTLATLGAVDAATVLTTSISHLARGMARPQGFVRSPPALTAWLGPADSEGLAGAVGRYVAHAYPDRAQELVAALTWGHTIAAAEPLARVVVACADVAGEQAMLERCVRDVCGDTAACFIGAGPSLRRDPLFVGASSILAVAPVMRWDALSALVRAPCLAGAAAEGAARATLDERLRATERHELPLALVIDQLAADGGCPLLTAGLRRLLDLWRAAPRQARMAAWLEHFDQLLAAVGWPGLPPGHPHAEAARRAWNALCDRLCGLDAVLPPVGRGAALARLEHALDDTPRATTTPRLGLYVVNYATALALDPTHVWLSGLDSHAVVGGARPSPLLPLAAQRAVGVPGAEPGRDLWHARRLLAALAARGVEHHASYAAGDGEQRLAPSPLVPALAGAAIVAPVTQVPVRWRQAPAVLETTSDLAGTPLPAGSRVDGGVAVLAAQSAVLSAPTHGIACTRPHRSSPARGSADVPRARRCTARWRRSGGKWATRHGWPRSIRPAARRWSRAPRVTPFAPRRLPPRSNTNWWSSSVNAWWSCSKPGWPPSVRVRPVRCWPARPRTRPSGRGSASACASIASNGAPTAAWSWSTIRPVPARPANGTCPA